MFTVKKIYYIYRTRARHLELDLQRDVGSKVYLSDVLPPSIFCVARIGIQSYQALRELDTKNQDFQKLSSCMGKPQNWEQKMQRKESIYTYPTIELS